MVYCSFFEQVGACVNGYKDPGKPCIYWHRRYGGSVYAFILGVQTLGFRHLGPVSRDVEYERICEYFMEVCWFFPFNLQY